MARAEATRLIRTFRSGRKPSPLLSPSGGESMLSALTRDVRELAGVRGIMINANVDCDASSNAARAAMMEDGSDRRCGPVDAWADEYLKVSYFIWGIYLS